MSRAVRSSGGDRRTIGESYSTRLARTILTFQYNSNRNAHKMSRTCFFTKLFRKWKKKKELNKSL